MSFSLNYDYAASKAYCESIGLAWLGDEWAQIADREAFDLGFTQEQVDCAMKHSLWHVRTLFDPKSYSWYQRIGMALHFLFGRMKR